MRTFTRLTTGLFLILAVHLAAPAEADPVAYTFAGAGGIVSGTFTLDNAAPFSVVTSPGLARTATLGASPVNTLQGTFGGGNFGGAVVLTIQDVLVDSAAFEDFWRIRVTVNGPVVQSLDLLISKPAPGDMPLTFTPPPFATTSGWNHTFTVTFTSGAPPQSG